MSLAPLAARRQIRFGVGSSSGAALPIGLAAFYSLEEASGTRVDATGRGNDLSPTNTPGNAAGLVGNAISFVRASGQYLARASTADLAIAPTVPMYWGVWINPTDLASNADGFIVSKSNPGTSGYKLALDSLGRLKFSVGTTVGVKLITTGVLVTAAAWNYIEVWWDPATGKTNVCCNLGTITQLDVSANPPQTDASAAFNLGTLSSSGGGTVNFNGLIDQAGRWTRIPSTAERTYLYNSGAGRSYAEISTASP